MQVCQTLSRTGRPRLMLYTTKENSIFITCFTGWRICHGARWLYHTCSDRTPDLCNNSPSPQYENMFTVYNTITLEEQSKNCSQVIFVIVEKQVLPMLCPFHLWIPEGQIWHYTSLSNELKIQNQSTHPLKNQRRPFRFHRKLTKNGWVAY